MSNSDESVSDESDSNESDAAESESAESDSDEAHSDESRRVSLLDKPARVSRAVSRNLDRMDRGG